MLYYQKQVNKGGNTIYDSVYYYANIAAAWLHGVSHCVAYLVYNEETGVQEDLTVARSKKIKYSTNARKNMTKAQ